MGEWRVEGDGRARNKEGMNFLLKKGTFDAAIN
jgi:hypothetical protein